MLDISCEITHSDRAHITVIIFYNIDIIVKIGQNSEKGIELGINY